MSRNQTGSKLEPARFEAFTTGSFITPAAGVTQLLARPRSPTLGSFVTPATGVTQPLALRRPPAPSSCITPATGVTQLLAPSRSHAPPVKRGGSGQGKQLHYAGGGRDE
ncbi:hypothetical protein B0H17DRAFT_1138944 [Mycena rosella]|uniref:Uncharacterized protein n=1 Tax=Mycena rosella TaxID=1033263 RepID=A0AAD7D577_MYCRO|nr:hypothetical protein B0H17DRAFT_1138944 [Mycena rosella]